MSSNFSSDVIARLKQELRLKKDSELANAMHINRSTISTWRKNDSINLRKIHEAFPDLSMDIVLGIDKTERSSNQSTNGKDQNPVSEVVKRENDCLKAQVQILQQTISNLVRNK